LSGGSLAQQYDARTPNVATQSDSADTAHTAPEVMSLSAVPGCGWMERRSRRPKALSREKDERTMYPERRSDRIFIR
jgi:hypothetical protein